MALIRINPSEVISSSVHADQARQRVSSAKNGIRDISDRLDPKIKQRNNIDGRLASLAVSLGSIEGIITRIRSVVDSASNNYQRADERVTGMAVDLPSQLPRTLRSLVIGAAAAVSSAAIQAVEAIERP